MSEDKVSMIKALSQAGVAFLLAILFGGYLYLQNGRDILETERRYEATVAANADRALVIEVLRSSVDAQKDFNTDAEKRAEKFLEQQERITLQGERLGEAVELQAESIAALAATNSAFRADLHRVMEQSNEKLIDDLSTPLDERKHGE